MADTDRLVETWRQIIVGDGRSWVAFEHGTCVVLAEPADDLAVRAVEILREFGPVRTGTPAADFGTVPLGAAPGWVVTGHHPGVLTYVAPGELPEPDNLAVGLTGRSKRDLDAHELTVVHVEDKRA